LREHLYDLVDDGLESQADDLKNFLDAQKKNATAEKIKEEVAETYLIEHSGDYLDIRGDNGELIYRSAFLRDHPLDMRNAEAASLPVFRNRRIDKRPFRFMTQRVEANGHA